MSAHVIVYAVLCVLVIGLAVTVLILAFCHHDLIGQRDEARTERDQAMCGLHDAREARAQAEAAYLRMAAERDTATQAVRRLLDDREEDTVRLPAWTEFLSPQDAHDRLVVDQMEQQFQDGATGEGR